MPGVLDILTQGNTSELKGGKFGQNQSTSIDRLGPEIAHDGQIIAMVLADSYEAAREAAYNVKATYAVEPASATFGSAGLKVEDATKVSERHKKVPNKGDAEAALAAPSARTSKASSFQSPDGRLADARLSIKTVRVKKLATRS